MNRRRFLYVGATATLTAVAGCLESGTPPGATVDPTDEPTDEPTDTPTATPTGPELTDSSFEVTDVSCGGEGTDSQVTIGDERVAVEGTVDGRNGCYSAELVRAEYVADEDTLYLEVEAIEGDDGDACTQCIVEVAYTATVRFNGGEPGTVHLTQRGALTTSESETSTGSATPDAATSDGGSDH